MNKKEQFKNFARLHPELVTYIKNGDMSWQRFYEIYDIYGEEESAWSSYFNTTTAANTTSATDAVGVITDKIKNIDMSSIQEHIKTAQKALNLVSELTGKTETTSPLTATIPKVPRQINQFFED